MKSIIAAQSFDTQVPCPTCGAQIDRVLRHSCDTPACVKLQHLELGTHAQNVAECIARGRQAVWTAMPHAKLDEAKVKEIFRLSLEGWSQGRISDRIGNSRSVVSRILSGKNWKHVK